MTLDHQNNTVLHFQTKSHEKEVLHKFLALIVKNDIFFIDVKCREQPKANNSLYSLGINVQIFKIFLLDKHVTN